MQKAKSHVLLHVVGINACAKERREATEYNEDELDFDKAFNKGKE